MTAPAALPLFCLPVRVYWEDTDAGGVVFYANYLKYFERARTEWLRQAGIGQQTLKETEGAIFVVAEATVKYLQPARLDDAIEVSVLSAVASRASLQVQQQARRGTGPSSSLLCEASIHIACVDHTTFRPRRIPSDVLDRLLP